MGLFACLHAHQDPTVKESILKGTNLLPGAHSLLLEQTPFQKEGENLTELPPRRVYPFPLKVY